MNLPRNMADAIKPAYLPIVNGAEVIITNGDVMAVKLTLTH